MSVKAIAWSYGQDGNSVIIGPDNNLIIESELNQDPVEIPVEYVDELVHALERAKNIINYTGEEDER